MPASDSGHLGVPSLPVGGVGSRILEWLQMATYVMKLDDITSTNSSGEIVLTNLPPDILPIALIYDVTARFAGDSEPAVVHMEFGSTSVLNLYGILNHGQLGSTNSYGKIPLPRQDTSTTGISLAVTIDFQGDDDTAPSAGTLELWLEYRLNSNEPRMGGVRAK